MKSIPFVADRMRDVLTYAANRAGRDTGFVQRRSKLTGALFAQTLILSWLHNPNASLEALTQTAASLNLNISPQGLDQRFIPQAAELLKQVLDAAVTEVVSVNPVAIPVLQRFSAVILQDSSIISLPRSLAGVWQGGANASSKDNAALKIQVRLDISGGSLQGPLLQHGRNHDHSSPFQTEPVPRGALRIADLGFFSLDVLRDLDDQGAFFLSRLQVQTAVFDTNGKRLDLAAMFQGMDMDRVDTPVLIGSAHRVTARLLATRVPREVAAKRRRQLKAEGRRRGQMPSKSRLALADWTILVTNAPQGMLSLEEALVLARARWQIELLFKLWKEHGKIDEWRSEKPWRILCEVYAKLTAMVIQHWVLLVSCWAYPDRSLVKAAQTVRSCAILVVIAVAGAIDMTVALEYIVGRVSTGCRMNKRRSHPNTYQLLQGLADAA